MAEVSLEPSAISRQEFEQIRSLAYERFGLDLHSGKQALVAARLARKLRELKLRSFDEYYRHVLNDSSGEALLGLIDALATNFTSFLREPTHFSYLVEHIWPAVKDRLQVRIWSAACSTGEEPYSILFSLAANAGASLNAVRVLATDISTTALASAEKGIFTEEHLEALPPDWRRRFFLRGQGQWKGSYRVKPEVRAAAEFRRVNLIEPRAGDSTYPLIFCRNVMIYFDKQTQTRVVQSLTNALEPGGHLFIGHAESLMGVEHSLEFVRPAIYRKPDGKGRRK